MTKPEKKRGRGSIRAELIREITPVPFCILHVGRIEVAVRPGREGTIVLRPVFSSQGGAVAAVSKSVATALQDVVFRQRLHNAAVRAISLIPRDACRAAELRFLIAALVNQGL